jgi:hypothetical protein
MVFRYIVDIEMTTIAIKITIPAFRVRLITVSTMATITKVKISPKDAMPSIIWSNNLLPSSDLK